MVRADKGRSWVLIGRACEIKLVESRRLRQGKSKVAWGKFAVVTEQDAFCLDALRLQAPNVLINAVPVSFAFTEVLCDPFSLGPIGCDGGPPNRGAALALSGWELGDSGSDSLGLRQRRRCDSPKRDALKSWRHVEERDGTLVLEVGLLSHNGTDPRHRVR